MGRARWMASLSMLVLLAAMPATASASHHRHVAPHGRTSVAQTPVQPPFGSAYRPVCGPVGPEQARCLAEVVTASAAPAGVTATPLVTTAPLGYGPPSLQDAYGIVSEAATSGSSQTVAVVDAYDDPTAESDLAAYRSAYGLPACAIASGCLRKVDQRGGTSSPPANADWAGEISLDLDAVSAICPRCHILLVEADSAYIFDLAAAANEAASLGATQISNSYGAGEFSGDTAFNADYLHPGVAVTASTGDDGYGVAYPASSPYVTAVGGTSLIPAPSAAPRGWTETAWAGAGSGCSPYEAKPPWQSDVGCATRTIADVSAVADPATGAAVYYGGSWYVYGGTSLASPIVAAYDALIGSAAASAQYFYLHPGSYYDVTSGSNGSCGSYLCTALAGFDGPTGLGTPHGAGLQRAPTVGTGAASSVTGAAATLHGTVDPNGYATTYHFEYGTTSNYGSVTTTASAGSDASVHGESAALSGLTGTTTYHFRIVATNANGTRYGIDNIFRTGAGPPVPTNTVAPQIVGLPQVGARVTSTSGTWTGLPTAYAYQWWHCVPSGGGGCVPSAISGATESTYTVQSADLGASVYVAVRAQNANGWSAAAASYSIGPIAAPVPANTAAPHVTGTGQVGSTLSASTGTWSGTPTAYRYQWWRCVATSGGGCLPAAISGAATSSYTAANADLGAILWVTVRAQNANGWSTYVNSDNALGPIASQPTTPIIPNNPVTPVTPSTTTAPSNAIRPHVSGSPLVGATLTVTSGTWSGSPDGFDYVWLDCRPVGGGCVPSAVGSSASYVVATGDATGTVYAQVRAHNGGGWSSYVVSDNSIGPITAPTPIAPVVTPPSLTRLALKPTSFHAARHGASVAATTGARVTYTLSASAYVAFAVQRSQPGRSVGGRCVAPTAGNRRRVSCTRWVAVRGSFGYPAKGYSAAGSVAFRFTGRLAGASLPPGSYRLTATAVGTTGARSATSRAAFKILR